MPSALELFVLPATIYPRRVLIYLQEKGLDKSEHIKQTVVGMSQTGQMTAPGKPEGTVPMLKLPNGQFVKQSLSIIDYLEDICDNPVEEWQKSLSNTAGRHNFRGTSPQERARHRDVLSLVDEASSYFGLACHKGSALFTAIEETNADAARLIMNKCVATLGLIDRYYDEDQRFQSEEGNDEVMIVDCVLFALLHFAHGMYGWNFFKNGALPHLAAFYKTFGVRKSAKIEAEHWKMVEGVASMARQWL